jgi:hypothetical protein
VGDLWAVTRGEEGGGALWGSGRGVPVSDSAWLLYRSGSSAAGVAMAMAAGDSAAAGTTTVRPIAVTLTVGVLTVTLTGAPAAVVFAGAAPPAAAPHVVTLSAPAAISIAVPPGALKEGYLYRAECLKPLVGRDVKVWGGGLPRWASHGTAPMFTGHYVAGDEKCRAMLAAKIALNPNHYAEIAGTNKRTFELAAIGAFQLTDTPALSDVFEPGTEVAQYDTVEELLEKLDYYLARPELRQEMARKSQVRAHSEHTYEHRWTAMIETLGLRPPSNFPVQPEDLRIRAT